MHSLRGGDLHVCVWYGVDESVVGAHEGFSGGNRADDTIPSDSTFTRHAGQAAGYRYPHHYGAPPVPAPAPFAAQYPGATNSSNGEGGSGGAGGGGGAVRLSIPVRLAAAAVEPSAGMGVHARLTGAADANFTHVLTETGVRCTLRGLGTADAPNEPLQVVLEAPTPNALQAARALVENLVGIVVTDIVRTNPSAAAMAPPIGYPQSQSAPTGCYGMPQQPPLHAMGRQQWGEPPLPHHMGGMGMGMGMRAPQLSSYTQPPYNNGVSYFCSRWRLRLRSVCHVCS